MIQSGRAESRIASGLLRNTCAALAALLLLGSASLEAANCEPSPRRASAAAAEVVLAVQGAFEALRDENQNSWKRIITADFFAFDNGARFDGAQLFNAVKTAHAAGKTYLWNITQPDPHVSCESAWINYVNRGSIRDADGNSVAAEWLESAVLRRVEGRWRLAFLHSTPVGSKH